MFKYALYILILVIFSSCSQQLDKKHKATTSTELFDDTKMHTCHIYSKSRGFWDAMTNDYHKKKTKDFSNYQNCKIILDGKTIAQVGIRFKGESSYTFQTNMKKSFKLKFDQFSKKGNYQGYKKINLNNQYKDPTFMREKLMLDVLNSENIPSAKSSFCEVYYNDELLGLYLLVEEVNNDFLKTHFKSKKGNLINGKPNGFLTMESVDSTKIDYNYRRKNHRTRRSHKKLTTLVHALNAPSDSNYMRRLNKVFDVELCLKNWAINNVFVNVDAFNLSYQHNYLLYFDKSSKQAKWLGYDYNYAFGCWSSSFTLKQMEELDVFYYGTPLVEKLLKVDDNRVFYSNYIQHLVVSKIESGWLRKNMSKYYTLIQYSVRNDENKLTSNNDFEINIEEAIGDIHDPGAFVPGLSDFMNTRAIQIRKQLKF